MPRAETPLMTLAEALAITQSGGNPSDAILAQEARGQAELIASAELPIDSDPPLAEAAKHIAGLTIGERSDDGMFTIVRLPPGWRKERTDHSMWSKLLDTAGRERAAIFYKAAIYDRAAHIHWKGRYGVASGYQHDGVVGVTDACQAGEYLFVAGRIDPNAPYEKGLRRHEYRQTLIDQCTVWLDEHHPEHRSPWAYWSDEGASR